LNGLNGCNYGPDGWGLSSIACGQPRSRVHDKTEVPITNNCNVGHVFSLEQVDLEEFLRGTPPYQPTLPAKVTFVEPSSYGHL
jgi:hypothetical protein